MTWDHQSLIFLCNPNPPPPNDSNSQQAKNIRDLVLNLMRQHQQLVIHATFPIETAKPVRGQYSISPLTSRLSLQADSMMEQICVDNPDFSCRFLNGPFSLGYGPAMVAMEGLVCVFQYASLHFTSSVILQSMEPLGPWSQDVKTFKLLRHSDGLKGRSTYRGHL